MTYSDGYGHRRADSLADGGHRVQRRPEMAYATHRQPAGAFYESQETWTPDEAAYRTAAGVAPILSKVMHVTVALASIALMLSVAVWGYDQVRRDVAGVPVVVALDGPMRVAPDQPGGQISSHAGLAVNAVKAQGVAEPVAETVRLAPQDVALADEDAPMTDLAARPADAAATIRGGAGEAGAGAPVAGAPVTGAPVTGGTIAPEALPLVEARVTLSTSGIEGGAAADALARAITEGVRPLGAEPEGVLTQASAEGTPAPVVTGPGLARSLRPLPRPAGSGLAGTASAGAPDSSAEAPSGTPRARPEIAARATATAPVPAASTIASEGGTDDMRAVAPGTRLVQLGAFQSVEDARTAWRDMAQRFGPLMESKSRLVQRAEAGGRSFWRLRAAGFEDLSQARRFCSALVAKSADCIPVVAR